MTTLHADECPYPRPFPPGFRECPAYRSSRLVPFDSRYRPLRPERTCQHLEVGAGATAGRYYARCAVGTAGERRNWADPERERQMAEVEAFTGIVEERLGGLTEELWAAKARQLSAFESGVGGAAATAELEQTAQRFLVEMEALLRAESERLERLNLPVETCVELFREILARWVPQRSAETPRVPDELVERFPEQAWWLLRPRTPARH